MADLVRAINDGDDQTVQDAVVQLSRSKRYLAPLTLAVGAIAMLFQGLRLLFTEWRLSLVQIIPAMWIWFAMFNLKLHVLRGHEFRLWTGALAAVVVLAIALITALSFYLNAVFAFAIVRPGRPQIRPAFTMARRHLDVILGVGLVVGIALGVSSIIVPRWGLHWFALSLGIVIGVMMLTYVTVPSRLVGMKAVASPRDKLAAAVVGGAVGALVCTPPYVMGRIGIIMLGSRHLFVLGVILVSIGFTLQAGATGAVKAVKMSAKLVAGNTLEDDAGDTVAGPEVTTTTPAVASTQVAPGERSSVTPGV
jgi:hypothetical protein